nr:uncharacterized protein LOC131782868 [Pocillopora verrucosa]
MSTEIVPSLSECLNTCVTKIRCKSLNFCSKEKSCILNDARRHAHPEDYGTKAGCIYMDVFESPKNPAKAFFQLKSCAAIQQEWPQADSGYYWITIGSREVQVYCDMTSYGGGWTLVVTISSKSNDHLQGAEVHCFKPTLCVPFVEENSDIVARKLADEDIHEMLHFEGTFRVDVLEKTETYAVFYQIPNGPEKFNSTCGYGTCPRIIISHSYPYQWETNNCTNIDKGYRIYRGCHRVFDGHDDGECGHKHWWKSSKYPGRRALYGYPQCHVENNHGIYLNNSGMLFVK